MVEKLNVFELNGLSDEGCGALPYIEGPHARPVARLPSMNDNESLEGARGNVT